MAIRLMSNIAKESVYSRIEDLGELLVHQIHRSVMDMFEFGWSLEWQHFHIFQDLFLLRSKL